MRSRMLTALPRSWPSKTVLTKLTIGEVVEVEMQQFDVIATYDRKNINKEDDDELNVNCLTL